MLPHFWHIFALVMAVGATGVALGWALDGE
jgi:hypothetical protein